jgi:hypothetical protein
MRYYKAEITAYYPSNEGVEGGYYDALGNKLNPDYNTCACPKCIPFHTKIRVEGTGTKYDGKVYECLDRGSSIVVDSKGFIILTYLCIAKRKLIILEEEKMLLYVF